MVSTISTKYFWKRGTGNQVLFIFHRKISRKLSHVNKLSINIQTDTIIIPHFMSNSYLHVINLLTSGASDNVICLSAWFLNNKCLTLPFIYKKILILLLPWQIQSHLQAKRAELLSWRLRHNSQLRYHVTNFKVNECGINQGWTQLTPLLSGQAHWPVIYSVWETLLETEKTYKGMGWGVQLTLNPAGKSHPPVKGQLPTSVPTIVPWSFHGCSAHSLQS